MKQSKTLVVMTPCDGASGGNSDDAQGMSGMQVHVVQKREGDGPKTPAEKRRIAEEEAEGALPAGGGRGEIRVVVEGSSIIKGKCTAGGVSVNP